MRKPLKRLVLGLSLPWLLLADLSSETLPQLTLAREAAAIVGAPLTPVSVAGVARRTTRRVVVAGSAAATSSAAAASASQQQATAQQQQATATQQQATATQQQATATQQQAVAAQQQAGAGAPRPPAGAPAVGTIVAALPGGCVSAPKGGVEYYNCGGIFYRPAFQGNNLVYVVQ